MILHGSHPSPSSHILVLSGFKRHHIPHLQILPNLINAVTCKLAQSKWEFLQLKVLNMLKLKSAGLRYSLTVEALAIHGLLVPETAFLSPVLYNIRTAITGHIFGCPGIRGFHRPRNCDTPYQAIHHVLGISF